MTRHINTGSDRPRCWFCRTRRATFAALLSHIARSGHPGSCTCGGYHHPHRFGSPCCEGNSYACRNRALREGASAEEVEDATLTDILTRTHQPSRDQSCPF